MKKMMNKLTAFAAFAFAAAFGLTAHAAAVAKIGDTEYDTLAAALEAVAADPENKTLTWVDGSVWAADKEVYYNGNFYTMSAAIVAACADNSAEPAKLFVRPNYSGLTVAHDLLKTSITIYGNNASVGTGWEPSIEMPGEESLPNGSHTLTKNVHHRIYSLHDGAGFWGSRCTTYEVSLEMVNCQDVHEILNNSASAMGLTNVRLVNCSFDGNSKGAVPPYTNRNPGTVWVEGCTFANTKIALNVCMEQGDANSVIDLTVKNCTFVNCAGEGPAKGVIRTFGTVGKQINVTVDGCTFTDCSTTNPNVSLGKNSTTENNALVKYVIKNTAATVNAYTQGTADLTSFTVKATETVTDDTASCAAKIVETGVKYATLEAAIAAAATDGTTNTIKMLANYQASDRVVIAENKAIVLDLNGKTVSGSVATYDTETLGYFLANYGNLTVTNSVEDVCGSICNVTTVFGDYAQSTFGGICNASGATLVFQAGKVGGSGPGGSAVFNKGTCVIDGGTFQIGSGDRSDNGNTNYTIRNDGTMTVNGGQVTGYSRGQFSNSGTLTVNNMTIGGGKYYYNFYVWGGSVVVKGGTIVSEPYTQNCYATGLWVTPDASLTIEGGNFTQQGYGQYGKTFVMAVAEVDGVVQVKPVLKGGTYNVNPATDSTVEIAEGYMVKADTPSEGLYTVVQAVARIGDTKYASVAEATSAAEDGDVVEILVDSVELALSGLNSKHITYQGQIDENGKPTTIVTGLSKITGDEQHLVMNTTLRNFVFRNGSDWNTMFFHQTFDGTTFDNCKFTGSNGVRMTYLSNYFGTSVFTNCVIDSTVYGVHVDGADAETDGCHLKFVDSDIVGWNSYGGAITTITFDGCRFVNKANNPYHVCMIYGANLFITNSSFATSWCVVDGYQRVGVASGTGTARLDNCTVASGTVAELCLNSAMTGVVAIDAKTDAAGKYTAGTFVTDATSSISVADGYGLRKTADHIWSVVLLAAQIVSADGETTTGYLTLQDAFDNVQANETINVLRNNSETITITNTCQFAFKSNGYTLGGAPTTPAGYEFRVNGDGTCNYGKTVAKIGTKPYFSLAEAVAAAKDNDVIEVLNGTWDADAIGAINNSTSRYVSYTVQAAEGATVKFTATVDLGYDDSSTVNATRTVKNISFENATLGLDGFVGVTVEGCTFVGSGYLQPDNINAGALVIRDNCTKNHKTQEEYPASQITVKNCTFSGTKTGAPAIRFRDAGNVTMTGNTIQSSAHNGILFELSEANYESSSAKVVDICNNTINEWNSGNVEGGGRAIRFSANNLAAGSTVAITNNYFTKAKAGLDSPDYIKMVGAANATVNLNDNSWNNEFLSAVSGNAAYYTVNDEAPALASVKTTKIAVAKIGDTEYETLAGAAAAVQSGETISLLRDVTLTEQVWNKTTGNITLEGNNHSIIAGTGFVSENDNTGYLLRLDGAGVVIQNVTLDGNGQSFYRGLLGVRGSGDKLYKNINFTNTLASSHAVRYGYVGNGDTVTFDGCDFNTTWYAIHFDGSAVGNVVVKDCDIRGFNALSGSLASCIFDSCRFLDSTINNPIRAIQTYSSNLTITNSSFSASWCVVDSKQTVGIAEGTGTARLDNCTVASGTVAELCLNSAMTGVVAIDAKTDAAGKYTAGTFVTDATSLIALADNHGLVKTADHTWTIVRYVAEVVSEDSATTNKYQTLQTAFDVVQKDQTVGALADNSEAITVTNTCTFAFKSNGYTLGGAPTTPAGYEFRVNGDGTCNYGKTVAKIGTKPYFSLAEAVAAVSDGGTIQMTVANVDEALPNYGTAKSFTIKGLEDGYTGIAGAASAAGAGLAENGVTFENINWTAPFDHRNMANVLFKNCKFTGTYGVYYGYASGSWTFTDCTFEQTGNYAAHFDEGKGVALVFENCSVRGKVNGLEAGYANTVVFTGCTFDGGADYDGEKYTAEIKYRADTTFVGCTFTKKFADGLADAYNKDDNGVNIVSGYAYTFKNCAIQDSTASVESLVVRKNLADASHAAIDAGTDSEGKYNSGMFVTKNTANIPLSAGCVLFDKGNDVYQVGLMINKDDEQNKVPAIEQTSDVKVDTEAVEKVVTDPEAAEKMKTETTVKGVKLTTEAPAAGQSSGMQAVVDKAKDASAEVKAAIESDSASMVTVQVDVVVTPISYTPPAAEQTAGAVAFELTPKATVTVVTTDGAETTTVSEVVEVTNGMIDQDQKITVSIYTGFLPSVILHKDENGKLIDSYAGDDFEYKDGICTLLISHFSTLEAIQNATYVATADGKMFTSVQAAFDYVTNGTVTLLKDAELTAAVTLAAGKKATFDLGGKKLKWAENATEKTSGLIANSGKLTLTGGGTLDAGTAVFATCTGDGETTPLNIEDGFYKGAFPAAGTVTNAGPILISGGYFTSVVPAAFCAVGYLPDETKSVVYDMYTVKDALVYIRNVKAQQRYPWNGYVDITFEMRMNRDEAVTLFVAAYYQGQRVTGLEEVTWVNAEGGATSVNVKDGSFKVAAKTERTLHLAWNSNVDGAFPGIKAEEITVKVFAKK